jgi:hypothetical protein
MAISQLEMKAENPLISAHSAFLALFSSMFSARSAFFRFLFLIGLVFPEHVMMNIKNIGCVYHPRRLVSKFQVS